MFQHCSILDKPGAFDLYRYQCSFGRISNTSFNPFNHGRFAKSMDFSKSSISLIVINCLCSHQLSSSSFLSCIIIIFGHCFFPLPVEGADWFCQSAMQASFLRYLVMKFWENAQERGIFIRLPKILFLILESLVYLGFLHKLLS